MVLFVCERYVLKRNEKAEEQKRIGAKRGKRKFKQKAPSNVGEKRGVLARNELMEREVFSPMGVMVVLKE